MSRHRIFFRLTRVVLLRLPAIFKTFAKLRKPAKRLLIVRTDAIGDYLLFRNFLEITATTGRFAGFEIELLGNPLWKDLAERYDSSYVSRFIFAKTDALYERPWQTLKLAVSLYRRNYAAVLQSSYTRNLMNDGLAALTGAPLLVGFDSDTEALPAKYKRRTDRFYTQLVASLQPPVWEFDRARHFFEAVTGTGIALTQPGLPTGGTLRSGIVIAPGAGHHKRGWERDKFLVIMTRLLHESPEPITIVGGPAETETARYLAERLASPRVTDLTAKTTLPDLVEHIARATALIGNESSAIHIAAACRTPSVCILGGGHFGRFAPYPEGLQTAPICIYQPLPCYNCNWLCKFETARSEPFPCISTVEAEQAWLAIRSVTGRETTTA